MNLKTSMVSAALAFAALTGVASRAQASVALPPEHIYTFTGACAVGDCTGVATGTLTFRGNLENGVYVLANDIFESLSYTSNLESFNIAAANINNFSGTLGTTPGPDAVTIGGSSPASAIYQTLYTQSAGTWCATCAKDTGPTHVWMQGSPSAAPEPSTWALMLVGVGLAGAALRRRPMAIAAA